MREELLFDIPKDMWLTENGAHGHNHWAVSGKRRKLRATARATAPQGVRFDGKVHVTAYVQYPTNQRADPGNAIPTVKPLLDGLTDAGLWADDDSTHLVGPDMRREPGVTGTRGLHRIRLVIEEIEDYA